tara:strand:+ start:4985 stop:5719 length:735 start_codon:yes stop_codon:yes gene_type:complete
MKYTLITACLNSIKTIEKTIESILIQKHLPIQHIFVDGGSNDGTLEYLLDVEIKFKELGVNFLLIKQITKGGIYEAWNMSLKKLDNDSDYIFILNSDDWYLNNTIEFVSNFFNKNNSTEVLCGQSLNYFDNKKTISKNKSLKLFPFLMPINHPACFMKKVVYDKVGKFNKDYRVSGDYDFLYRCFNSNINFEFTKIVLVKRLMGGFAESNKILARQETLKIGLINSRISIFPKIAFLLRKLIGN